jgi:hypothetical protein
MPYPNEHACRLKQPEQDAQYNRTARTFNGKQADVIWMKPKGADTVEMQAVRFPKDRWSAAEARAVCEGLKGRFEAAAEVAEGGRSQEPIRSDRTFSAGPLREASIELAALSEENLPEGVIAVARDSVLLRTGVNKTKTRLYRPEFVRSHLGFLEGGFSHVDHPSASEARDRPERSLGTLAAYVGNARYDRWTDADGRQAEGARGDVYILGTAAGREMREAFRNDVVRQTAGLSIYWPHGYRARRERLQEGSWVDVPVALVGDGKFSVDFVTAPTAGGQVGTIREAQGGVDDMDFEKLSIEELADKRPDLVESLQEAAREGYVKLEDMPDEPKVEPDRKVAAGSGEEGKALAEVQRLETALAEATRRTEALERRNRQLEAAEIVRTKLTEADLPDKARVIVEAHFAGSDCQDAAKFTKLVEAEIQYVKDLGAALSETGRVRGVVAEGKTGDEPINVLEDVKRVEGLAK